MGRLIFNSAMGIVGARGQIANCVYFKSRSGSIERYSGAYSRRDVRGTSNILCKLSKYKPMVNPLQNAIWTIALTARQTYNKPSEDIREDVLRYTFTYLFTHQLNRAKQQLGTRSKYYVLNGFVFGLVYITIDRYAKLNNITDVVTLARKLNADWQQWNADNPMDAVPNIECYVLGLSLFNLQENCREIMGIDYESVPIPPRN